MWTYITLRQGTEWNNLIVINEWNIIPDQMVNADIFNAVHNLAFKSMEPLQIRQPVHEFVVLPIA